LVCDSTGWVCENHPDRPGVATASGPATVAPECHANCNPSGGIDEPPKLSRRSRASRSTRTAREIEMAGADLLQTEVNQRAHDGECRGYANHKDWL
jgi:hypothetical protein